jgi:glycerophosphoryl diester phosphodiesterase
MMPLRPAWLSSRPIAHRGLHDGGTARPENSLAAFDAAAEAGYPCELDVQLTRSGTLVVLHDYDLERATGVKSAKAARYAVRIHETRARSGKYLSRGSIVKRKSVLCVSLSMRMCSSALHIGRAVDLRNQDEQHALLSSEAHLDPTRRPPSSSSSSFGGSSQVRHPIPSPPYSSSSRRS